MVNRTKQNLIVGAGLELVWAVFYGSHQPWLPTLTEWAVVAILIAGVIAVAEFRTRRRGKNEAGVDDRR